MNLFHMGVAVALMLAWFSVQSTNAGHYEAIESGDVVWVEEDDLELSAWGLSEKASKKPIALYVDDGAWAVGKKHLKLFFQKYNLPYESIDRRDVLEGRLTPANFDVLVMPGGASWKYLETLGEAGGQAIKKFVVNGGNYVGICAGAFYAVSQRQGGYKTGPYGIGLLDGTAYDGTALNTAPFRDGVLPFHFLRGPEAHPTMNILLLGGPSFIFDATERARKNIETLAQFDQVDHPQGVHPTVIRLTYGQGKVFLSGPHPEIEESLLGVASQYKDPESDWPWLNAQFQELLGLTE